MVFVTIMTIAIYKVLKIVYEYQINTYKEFLNQIATNKNILNNTTNIVVNMFLCISFFIMTSGFGTYFNQEYRNK